MIAVAKEKIAIIGGGRLGSALALALAKKHKVVVSDPNGEQLFALTKKSKNIDTVMVNSEAADAAPIVVLAVKPAAIARAVETMKSSLPGKLVISCAAGTPIRKIEAAGGERVIRAMPNLCLEVGEAMIAYSLGSKTGPEDETRFLALFSPLGKCVRVEEKDINAITAASGSGPAFTAFFAKAVADAAAESGLSPETAKIAVAQTLVGTGKLILAGKSPDDIIHAVASPGGTTEAGLKSLEEKGVKDALKSAIAEAIKKAKELIIFAT
jgi:pyrroline-5-carboxylate reductase